MSLVFCLSVFLVLVTQGAYDYYNQSDFDLYKFDRGDRSEFKSCAVRACYSTSGADDSTVPSDFGVCDWSRSCIENQRDIGLVELGPDDLDQYEINSACPLLEKVPSKYRKMGMLWADDVNCTTCPRYECDNATTAANTTWMPDYTLSFSTSLITSYCYECDCELWRDSYKMNDGNRMRPTYAWDCYIRAQSTSYLRFDSWECDAPTPSPTDNPTMEPTEFPTFSTTFSTTEYECKDNVTSYSVGEYYFSLEEQDSCETFCLCEDGGSPHCKKGWSKIMDDSKLYPYFIDFCGDYTASCYSPKDAGDLYKYYDPADVCDIVDIGDADMQCPRCECSDKDAGKTTNTSTFNRYQNASTLTGSLRINCAECSCEWGGVYDNKTHYSSCNSYDSVWEDDYPTECEYSAKRCFSDSGYYDADAGTTLCYYDDYERECAFAQTVITTSPEEVCIETDTADMGEWGCSDSMICSGYGGVGCYYSDFSYTVKEYDCMNNKWLSDVYSMSAFYSCCSMDSDGKGGGGTYGKCNNRTTDDYLEGKKECTKSSELEDYYKFTSQCYYSSRNLEDITSNDDFIRAAFCGDSLDYNKYIGSHYDKGGDDDYSDVCELIQVIWQYNSFCDCNEYRIMTGNLNAQEDEPYDRDDMIASLQKTFDTSYSATATALYNWWMMFDCDDYSDTFSFTCNVSSPAEELDNSDGASSRSCWWSMILMTAFCVFCNNNNRAFALTLLVIVLISYVNAEAETYNWEQTGDGDVGACEFMGSQESESQVCDYLEEERLLYQDNTLTWRALIDACPALERQGCWTDDEHIDLTDLIWDREDCNNCPRCPCNNATDTFKYYKLMSVDMDVYDDSLVTADCYECECDYWDDAKDWAWSCSWDWSFDGEDAADSDSKCVTTDSPTSAPTESVDLWCVVGDNFENNTVGQHYYIDYQANTSCYWSSIDLGEVEADPKVCLNDKFYFFGSPEWGVDDSHLCNSLGRGCFYADWDMEVEVYDCVLGSFVTEKYPVLAKRMCCDNGYYCNNQSITMETVSYEDYSNETFELECKNSNILREYWEMQWDCYYGATTDDEDWLRHMQCGDDYRYSEGDMCDNLELIWEYRTRCECNKAAFYEKYVNSSINVGYNASYALRYGLAEWSERYDCGKDDWWDWKCDSAVNLNTFTFHYVISFAVVMLAINNN